MAISSLGKHDWNVIGERAAAMVPPGGVIGLGSGRAAMAFVHALGKRVQQGLHIQGIPTSQNTADLANELGIPLTTLDEVDTIDLAVDGADEVDPNLDLIKGLGGALVREKIVASAARRLVIVVGTEKLVQVLGEHQILPVEVVPFGLGYCHRRLLELGCRSRPRMGQDGPFITDNGNHILDCAVNEITRPAELETAIRSIPGVVGSGLFLGMAHVVLVQNGDQVETRQRGIR